MMEYERNIFESKDLLYDLGVPVCSGTSERRDLCAATKEKKSETMREEDTNAFFALNCSRKGTRSSIVLRDNFRQSLRILPMMNGVLKTVTGFCAA